MIYSSFSGKAKNACMVLLLCMVAGTIMAQQPVYPKPYGVLPSERHLRWHELETYVLVHFTPTTFENKEWGFGDADPKIFNPTNFDAAQIANAAKAGGFKGLIIVGKHHDGFALWPTKTTPYNISKSPWKNGKGDMVREFEQATRKAGMKFGIYCSPWDRNHPQYATYEYVKVFREQLRELYTNYGELFIAWFDGANGGDGYYGGAREKRQIDRGNYYGWDTTFQIVHDLQPGAVIFSDAGDVRWVGNEEGHAAPTSWATFTPQPLDGKTKAVPGELKYWLSPEGTRNGEFWKPAECDVPLRPGWFYHPEQDGKQKTASQLFDLYCQSVGRGGALDLGLSPDKRGLLHDGDVASLKAFGEMLKRTFAVNLAASAKIVADNVRGGNNQLFGVQKLTDADRYSYWATDDAITNAGITLTWKQPVTFNIIRLRENIKLGQRIEKVEVDVYENGSWKKIAEATSIGSQRLIRLQQYVTASQLRIRVVQSPVCIALSEVGVFKEPEQLPVPKIERSKQGDISLVTENPVQAIRYTTNGKDPDLQSPVYNAPFAMPEGGMVKAKSFNTAGQSSETGSKTFGISKSSWKVLATSFENSLPAAAAANAIDDDAKTMWHTWVNETTKMPPPQHIAVDMGKSYLVKGFTYLPRRSGTWGIVKDYEWQASTDGVNWTTVAKGEFANIKSNPVEQLITLAQPVTCRYFKFIGLSAVDDNYVSAAELGVTLQ